MKTSIGQILAHEFPDAGLHWPDAALDPDAVRVVMINEVCPPDPVDDFYGESPCPGHARSVLALFREAGMPAQSTGELLQKGIYLTNAVKTPKQGSAIDTATVNRHAVFLERELALFPSLTAVMLMGDVAIKAFNRIAKIRGETRAIPAESTYKIRSQDWFYQGLRLFPSYIVTGGSLAIERFKREVIVEDIGRMLKML